VSQREQRDECREGERATAKGRRGERKESGRLGQVRAVCGERKEVSAKNMLASIEKAVGTVREDNFKAVHAAGRESGSCGRLAQLPVPTPHSV
jgi:hypothetical protein